MKKGFVRLKTGGLSLVLLLAAACSSTPSPYDGLPHKGGKSIRYTKMEMRPFEVDASQTSLGGQWFMKDSLLYFMDSYRAGLKSFNPDGTFVANEIRQGRGPGEMVSAAWCSALDKETGNWVVQDHNAALIGYNAGFEQVFHTMSAWFNAFSSSAAEDLERLIKHPDPENILMYEYNYNVDRMQYRDGRVYMPVLTEHVKYNAYDLGANAKDYWRQAHILLAFDLDSMAGTGKLFGNYPPVYQKSNIPLYSAYDFAVTDNRIYVGFEADSLIYAFDLQGTLLYSIGSGQAGISGDYPATYSFEEYEKEYAKAGPKAGAYGRLYAEGGYLFRTCQTDAGEWFLQVYEDEILVGDIALPGTLEIFGYHEGWYYAFQEVDLEKESFRMLKFRL